MRGTSDTIELMQVIRLDAVIDEPPAKFDQSRSVVVDSPQQDRLVQNGDTGIDQQCKSIDHIFVEFIGMIGMNYKPNGQSTRRQSRC